MRRWPMLLPLAALLGWSHAAAARPVPIVIPEWQVIGPFEAGSREGLVHHLADPSGRIGDLPDLARTWPSALADGGRVAWRTMPAPRDEAGLPTAAIHLSMGGVDWEARQSELGAAGLLNAAYLHGTFDLEAPALLILEAERCTVRLNGVAHSGDPYAAGIARSVVGGRTGINTLLVASAGFGGERDVSLRLVPVTPEMGEILVVEKDVLLPDLVAGSAGSGWAAVAIVNLTDAWLPAVTVRVESSGLAGSATLPWALAPRASLRVPVPVTWNAPAAIAAAEEPVAIRVTTPRGEVFARATARIRQPGEARVETFLSSIDGSAQPFGVLPASRPDVTGMILSLHGAGVEARDQAPAQGRSEWATVIAPQGRRRYGFDWHDWSERDALEVLAIARGRFKADPSRVVLAGQSMGGHGVWVLGCHRPDLFSIMTPAAAWISYDSVVPFTLRRSTHEAPAELQSLMMQALAPGRVGGLLENLEGMPVRVFHGGKDDNIPPWQARWLVGSLQRRGVDARLCELADKKHWSDIDVDPARPEGCADTAALHGEWETARRDPWPRRLVIVTTDPDIGGDRAWLRLERQEIVARESRLEVVVVGPSTIRVATRNVGAFSLDLAAELGLDPRVTIEVDGEEHLARSGRRVLLEQGRGRWTARTRPEAATLRPGGLAKAIHRPFVIVVGTRARAAGALDVARAISDAWWVRAGGFAPIVRDVDVTTELRRDRALILVGGPDVNAETASIASRLAVVVDARGATVAGRRLAGEHFACAHWQPDPRAPDHSLLVLQGADEMGDELLAGLHPVAPGVGLPDWVVADPTVRLRGWGGFRAAGFWSPDFGFDAASTYGLQ